MAGRAPSRLGAWMNAQFRALVPDWFGAVFLGVPLARKLRFDPAVDGVTSRFGRLTAGTSLLSHDSPPKKRLRKTIVDAYIPAEHFLKRTVSAPRGARAKLDMLAELDLRQATPFRPEEVRFLLDQPKTTEDTVYATQWVAKRADIELWAKRLAMHGLRLRKVFVANSDLSMPIADLTLQIAGAGRKLRFLNAGLALMAAGAGAVGLLYPAWKAQQQTEVLNQHQADLQTRAVALRQEVQTLRAAEAERAAFLDILFRRPVLVDTIRELTIALPDNVWLGTLEFRTDKVVITGEAQDSAANTVLLLSEKPRFGNPRLSGQVARTATNAERFQITFDLEVGG